MEERGEIKFEVRYVKCDVGKGKVPLERVGSALVKHCDHRDRKEEKREGTSEEARGASDYHALKVPTAVV